jgi:hypothetical protein
MLDKFVLALATTALLHPAAHAQPLRIASDASHRWELAWDSVSLHDAATSALIRKFPLEGASQTNSRDFCPPDLVLTRTGTAYVTSNIQPVLWRVNPATATIERLDLELDSHHLREFGFTGLSASADGQTLYAFASSDGALWHLDPSTLEARRLTGAAADDADCARIAAMR